eukprot:350118-Hanusia_phi.AAC.4
MMDNNSPPAHFCCNPAGPLSPGGDPTPPGRSDHRAWSHGTVHRVNGCRVGSDHRITARSRPERPPRAESSEVPGMAGTVTADRGQPGCQAGSLRPWPSGPRAI